MDIFFQVVLVILLIFVNAFFVASEYALVGVRKTRITELTKKGNKTALIIQKALSQLDSFISSTQLGITLASLALGWIGEPIFAKAIEGYLSFFSKQIALVASHSIAIVIGFLTITMLHIIIGELVPKSIALQKSESVSQIIIFPLLIFTKIFSPFIWLLNTLGNLILKMLGFSTASERQSTISEEEIKIILSQSVGTGAIEKNEAEMMVRVFQMGDIPVSHIMVPRTEMIGVNAGRTVKEAIEKTKSNSFSRFPVYEGSVDSIIGLVHIKDLYKYARDNGEDKKLLQTHITRDIISIPESKRIDDILLEMKKRRVHMAVVNDEYGGTAGIVTLEDILEHLVGDIHDEFENPNKEIEKLKDGTYLVDGFVSLDRLQHKFKIPIKGQGFSTIGGLVFGLLGREPKFGDTVEIGNLSFEVTETQGRRIKTLKVRNINSKKN